jgi:hypothetical protein
MYKLISYCAKAETYSCVKHILQALFIVSSYSEPSHKNQSFAEDFMSHQMLQQTTSLACQVHLQKNGCLHRLMFVSSCNIVKVLRMVGSNNFKYDWTILRYFKDPVIFMPI